MTRQLEKSPGLSVPATNLLVRCVGLGIVMWSGLFSNSTIQAQGNSLRQPRDESSSGYHGSNATNTSPFAQARAQAREEFHDVGSNLQSPSTLTNRDNLVPAATPPSQVSSTLFRHLESTLFDGKHSQSANAASESTNTDPQAAGAADHDADQTIHDSQVRQASADLAETDRDRQIEPEGKLLMAGREAVSEPSESNAKVGQSAAADATDSEKSPEPFQGFNNLQLGETVKKLAINTGLVLVVAVAFILITKKNKLGSATSTKPLKATPVCHVEQTVSLGGKSLLKVVRIGSQQLAIAMDTGGIKSVVSLTSGFEEALETASEPETPPNLDHLLEIMKHLDLGRGKSKA